MPQTDFRSRLLDSFDSMPRRMRTAAQWVLDNPRDVALLTMSEQARRAGVAPASMTRLAQRMGFPGYEDLRAVHAERLRRGEGDFSGKTQALVDRRRQEGEAALAFDIAETVERHMAAFAGPKRWRQ